MEELIKQALDKYFSDFKDYQLLILIGFTIVIALLQIIQSIVVARKIENIKSDLKKAEIKFSRYNQLQVDALRRIYHLLAKFQLANQLVFNEKSDDVGHIKFKNYINNWISSYIECANEFSKEKILLTPELKSLFSRTIQDFDDVKKILIDERENLDYLEMMHDGNWNSMYEYEENESYEISKKIKHLKSQKSIENSNKHIRELRKKIEEVFVKMN